MYVKGWPFRVAAVAVVILLSLDWSKRDWQNMLFCGGHFVKRSTAWRQSRSVSAGSWLELSKGPEVDAGVDAKIMPVFPSPEVVWPGNSVQFAVIEPAHRRLYEDMLMSGSRYVLSPLITMRGASEPRERSMPKSCRLHKTTAVLWLDELKEVSEQTKGKVKYVAKHSVVGRGSISHVLNPSSLFETNEQGERVNYLRAQVDMLGDNEEQTFWTRAALRELGNLWEELRYCGEQLGEPRIESAESIKDFITKSSTWQLAEVWYKLRLRVQTHREQAQLSTEVNQWIKDKKESGQVYSTPDQAMQAMPQRLREAVIQMNNPMGLKLHEDFYEPFLGLLATNDAQTRFARLSKLAFEELKATRARVSLRNVFN